MSLSVTRYLPEHESAVREFNQRISPSGRRFSEVSRSHWLPFDDLLPRQEYLVAMDAHRTVRGAYILKHQEFLIKGNRCLIADYQFPLSEGIVDRSYAAVGVRLYQHAAAEQPRLFGLGVGDLEQPIAKLFTAFCWQHVPVPFFFRIVRANAVLRNLKPFRRTAARRRLCDWLAFTGLGPAAIHSRQLCQPFRRTSSSEQYDIVDSFGPWTDDLWNDCGHLYQFIAVRDRDVANKLYPTERVNPGRGHRTAGEFVRIKVSRQGRPIGWTVVIASEMENHKQFGNLRVGTIVDAFARPDDAGCVIAAARNVLFDLGVDLMVSNQMHVAWRGALSACGFLSGPTNFIFFASPALAGDMAPFHKSADEFHLNRGDGDGPINL